MRRRMMRYRVLAALSAMPPFLRTSALVGGLLAMSVAAHGQTTNAASVRLLIEDAIGQAVAQPAVLYDGRSAEWGEPIAKSTTAAGPVSVAPGRYWVVSAADESLAKFVTLAEGESKDVVIKVDRGLWVSFYTGESKPHDKLLLVLRPRAELERWLYWLRMRSNTEEMAILRLDATEEALAAARQLALVAPVLTETQVLPPNATKEEKEQWFARQRVETSAVWRILGLTGRLEDIDALLQLATTETPSYRRYELAFAAGLIEARHDTLEEGRLAALVHKEDATWAIPAAMALGRLGLPTGYDLLRRGVMQQTNLWERSSWAYPLIADTNPATMGVMREYLKAMVEEFKQGQRNPWVTLWPSLHLLTYGGREDWQLVASLSFERTQATELAGLSQNPRPFFRYALAYLSLLRACETLYQMRDRPAAEFESLRAWLNDAAGRQVQQAHPEEHPAVAYNSTVNSMIILQSAWIPHQDAVCFYRGWCGKEPVSKTMSESGGSESTLGSETAWFPYPESLDLFIQAWFKGGTRYLPQLDYIDLAKIEDAVKRLGNGRVPPGYELYRAYHRIAHRQRSVFDWLPLGERRWPYVLAYRERDASGNEHFGGGISGVASLKTEWRDNTLVLRLKLDQRAHYEQAGNFLGIGNRGSVEEYPHHRYMQDHGRPLIESVVVRRGPRRFVVTDTQQMDGDWLVFEAALDRASPADLWVDVHLKFVDQSVMLTESLFAGSQASLMRHTRHKAGGKP